MDETSYCQLFFSLFSLFMEVEESFSIILRNLQTESEFMRYLKKLLEKHNEDPQKNIEQIYHSKRFSILKSYFKQEFLTGRIQRFEVVLKNFFAKILENQSLKIIFPLKITENSKCKNQDCDNFFFMDITRYQIPPLMVIQREELRNFHLNQRSNLMRQNALSRLFCPSCSKAINIEYDLSYKKDKIQTSFLLVNVQFSANQPKKNEIKSAFDTILFSFPANLSKKSMNLSFFLMGVGCEGDEGVKYFFRKNENRMIFYQGSKEYKWEEVMIECYGIKAKPFILIYFLSNKYNSIWDGTKPEISEDYLNSKQKNNEAEEDFDDHILKTPKKNKKHKDIPEKDSESDRKNEEMSKAKNSMLEMMKNVNTMEVKKEFEKMLVEGLSNPFEDKKNEKDEQFMKKNRKYPEKADEKENEGDKIPKKKEEKPDFQDSSNISQFANAKKIEKNPKKTEKVISNGVNHVSEMMKTIDTERVQKEFEGYISNGLKNPFEDFIQKKERIISNPTKIIEKVEKKEDQFIENKSNRSNKSDPKSSKVERVQPEEIKMREQRDSEEDSKNVIFYQKTKDESGYLLKTLSENNNIKDYDIFAEFNKKKQNFDSKYSNYSGLKKEKSEQKTKKIESSSDEDPSPPPQKKKTEKKLIFDDDEDEEDERKDNTTEEKLMEKLRKETKLKSYENHDNEKEEIEQKKSSLKRKKSSEILKEKHSSNQNSSSQSKIHKEKKILESSEDEKREVFISDKKDEDLKKSQSLKENESAPNQQNYPSKILHFINNKEKVDPPSKADTSQESEEETKSQNKSIRQTIDQSSLLQDYKDTDEIEDEDETTLKHGKKLKK